MVKVHGRVRMIPQNGGGRHRADLAIETSLDRFRLARPWNNRNQLIDFHDLLDRHGYRLFWHLCDVGEPSLADLLMAAGFVELDNQIGFFGVEVSRRVIEGEMAVLSNA